MTKYYEIGFCRPPKHTQFRPGQSGNRKGRVKGSKNLATIVKAIADKKFPGEENGKTVKMTRVQLMFIQQFNKAAKGDIAAAKFIYPILEKTENSEAQKEKIMDALNIDNKEILLNYLKNNAESTNGQ